MDAVNGKKEAYFYRVTERNSVSYRYNLSSADVRLQMGVQQLKSQNLSCKSKYLWLWVALCDKSAYGIEIILVP